MLVDDEFPARARLRELCKLYEERPETARARAARFASSRRRLYRGHCAGPVQWGDESQRRRARSSTEASTHSFTSASGAITVPMSRPSRTAPPAC